MILGRELTDSAPATDTTVPVFVSGSHEDDRDITITMLVVNDHTMIVIGSPRAITSVQNIHAMTPADNRRGMVTEQRHGMAATP